MKWNVPRACWAFCWSGKTKQRRRKGTHFSQLLQEPVGVTWEHLRASEACLTMSEQQAASSSSSYFEMGKKTNETAFSLFSTFQKEIRFNFNNISVSYLSTCKPYKNCKLRIWGIRWQDEKENVSVIYPFFFFLLNWKKKTLLLLKEKNRWIIANSMNSQEVPGTWLRAMHPGSTPKVTAQNWSSADTAPASLALTFQLTLVTQPSLD